MGIINWLQLTNCGQQRGGEEEERRGKERKGEVRETSGDVTRNYAHGCTLGAFVARGLTTVIVRGVDEGVARGVGMGRGVCGLGRRVGWQRELLLLLLLLPASSI